MWPLLVTICAADFVSKLSLKIWILIPGVVDPTPCFGDYQYARSDDTAGMAEFVDQGLQTELTMEDIAKLEDQAT